MITRDPQTLDAPAVRRVFAIMAARGIDVRPEAPAPPDEMEMVDARIPARFRKAEVEHPQLHDWVQTMLATTRRGSSGELTAVGGPSLLMIGTTGTGKTYEAFGAIRALTSAGARLAWKATTAADLYAALRPRTGVDTERELATMARCPLLLLDDLGAAKASEWTEEITYRVINHRYAEMLPTLITSNLPVSQLRQAVGDRVASRLAGMTGRAIFTGPDRRRHPAA
ncbi:ATP-binding protein [Streptomyces hainanensis]|uniref:ATP-binding protein n=1 Tax=Streptomyces hainanensis TaxID=402648 RepID=A0A4R4TEA1_9ACTN|nr:ATP-binding protein [Streptomyces hainanensis]TDC75690.1 ATP-binding protein [Streptomyces hainanensis]